MNRLLPWLNAAPIGRSVVDAAAPRRDGDPVARLHFGHVAGDEPVRLASSSRGRALAVHLPTPYEPRYPYPLVVWLPGSAADEASVHDVLPGVSDQNFIGVGVDTRDWGTANDDTWLLELHDVLVDVRRAYHVHSERIFAAGTGAGAGQAMSALLRRPEWFAGALALGGDTAASPGVLQRSRELRGKRVLLATATDGVANVLTAVRQAATAERLRDAGVLVELHTTQAPPTRDSELLPTVNRWLVDAACAVV